jgi:hypothetical protein
MKNNSLLLLASLAVLATSASAAQSRIESEMLVLPAYVVAAPRHQLVERHINAGLNKLRQQAHAPLTVAPEFSALKAQVRQDSGIARAAQDAKIVRVAKS